jgi:6-phosphogluconate dehydrogenase
MVHNGIEYALMQAYAEGFELLAASEYDVDLHGVAEAWRYGSVVRSWLLDLAARALADDPALERIAGYVEDSGEGRWTVEAAVDHAVPVPTIAAALFTRFASRQDDAFANRLLAALRNQFGGHAVRAADEGADDGS